MIASRFGWWFVAKAPCPTRAADASPPQNGNSCAPLLFCNLLKFRNVFAANRSWICFVTFRPVALCRRQGPWLGTFDIAKLRDADGADEILEPVSGNAIGN